MIANDQELRTMIERIRHFQEQAAHLRIAEASPTKFRLSVLTSSATLCELMVKLLSPSGQPPVTS